MIHQDHSRAIFDRIQELVGELTSIKDYSCVFEKALSMVREGAEAGEIFLPVDLPMTVADVLGLPVELGEIAAAASTSLWAGADLMDDAADGQLVEAWANTSARLLALVSTNLLATLPHLLVGGIDDDGTASAAYSRAVSQALFAMSEGQSLDYRSAEKVDSIEAYLDLVRRKSGAEFALFAATPSLLSGATAADIDGWVRFGVQYGTMVQVFHDIVSTIAEGPRNDLLEGKRSLPVLHTLADTSGQIHLSFRSDLDLASKGDHSAVARAISAMTNAGAIRKSFQHVELLRFRASKVLPVSLASIDRSHPLRRLMAACSVV